MAEGKLTNYSSDDEGVALLQLDRPDARNAINTAMLDELLAHLAAAREDESVRALVLSSTDHMGLSAGADVREQLDDDARVHRMELFSRLYDELTSFPKPTIAACHGACVGGGAEIAVACDLRVGGSNLRLRFPGAALGVPVGPARLVTLCGLSIAKYLLLTSKEVDADMAYRWGLIHKVVPAPRTQEAALQLAAQIASHPPEAVARLKRMLHEWDEVEARSRVEGEGQVRWAGTHSVPARAGKAAKPPR
jgi:enoyl-CoA hydratase/carnithine racemase